MSSTTFRERARALQAQAAQLGADIAAAGASVEPGELFELSGDLQGVSNAVEGAQLVTIAHASAHEYRQSERGEVQVHHGVGFVDAMASSEVCLATGLGQWAAGRKVALAAALAGRFPLLLSTVVAGELTTGTAQKVVTVCAGLDDAACAAVEAVLADRLADIDPDRVTTVTRRVATRIAADQVAAATATNKRDRAVQVTPGPDGTTDWWARIPTDRSAAAWSAITTLAQTYTATDESLTADQARADAFIDLLLTNVTLTAKVTLGIPVITGPDGAATRDAAITERLTEGTGGDDTSHGTAPTGTHGTVSTTGTVAASNTADPVADHPGESTSQSATAPTTDAVPGTPGDVTEAAVECRPAVATGGLGLGQGFSLSAALMSGCEIPGIGFIDADTIEALLSVVPTDIGRALLDAHTGTLMESLSTAYRPPKTLTDFVTTRDGTCRMWGCNRPATRCDIDHARPWPTGPTTPTNLGGLCRRHHRLKQRHRWTYHLAPDGTATWTSPTGTTRVTLPDHVTFPPRSPVTTLPSPEREPAALEPAPF